MVLTVSACFHEGGHYYATKYYRPEEVLEIVYTKVFLIIVPCGIRHVEGTLLSLNQKRVVLLAGPIVGYIPIIALYFYSMRLFVEITILYFVVACSVDFFSIIFFSLFPKQYRKDKANQNTEKR